MTKKALIRQSMRAFCQFLIALSVLLSGRQSFADEEPTTFESYRRPILGSLADDFAKIAAARQDSAELAAAKERLDAIDQAVEMLTSRLKATRSQGLERLLNDAVALPQQSQSGAPGAPNANAAPDDGPAPGGLSVYAEFRRVLTPPAPMSAANGGLSEAELRTLRAHEDAYLRAAEGYVAQRAGAVNSLRRDEVGEIEEVILAIPFLRVPDGQWSRQATESLPQWARRPAALRSIELAALRAERPVTAYDVAEYLIELEGAGTRAAVSDYPRYLRDAAARMIESRNFHAGIFCFKIALANAEAANDAAAVTELRFHLGDILSRTGHAKLAAEQMSELLASGSSSSSSPSPSPNNDHAKAAMLRLKYLYEAGELEPLLTDSSTFRGDARCEPYMPQILYITWVAARRMDRAEESDGLIKSFLERFSDHPLAADMYLASAMTALAAGDYAEAQRLLEIIEYRYPKSKLLPKVKEIQARLAKSTGSIPSAERGAAE